MAVTDEQLRALVNTRSPDDDDAITACLAVGVALVTAYVPTDATVPEAVLDEATLLVAADQFHRRKAPNGILNQTYGDDLTAPVRVGRDPLAAAYGLLAPWKPPTFA